MPKTSLSLVFASSLLLAAPAAAMVSITNETEETHTVTFDHGDTENRHELAPGASIEEACPTGCGVRFGGHDLVAQDGDQLAIEEGQTRPVRQN